MRGFTSPAHAQRCLHVHGVIQNLFRVGRHLLRSVHHRMIRARSFTVWAEVTAACGWRIANQPRNPLRLSSLVILGVVARMSRCATRSSYWFT